jgi:quercetin dioxygenase-like cupin family protein
MSYIINEEVATVDIAPGVVQRPLVSKATGADGIFMGEIEVAVGAHIPWHYHSVEDIILVREGEGYVECDPGEKMFVKGGENSVIVKPGVIHRVVNTGDIPIKIIFGFPSTEVDRIVVENK